jgi:hypothetical protein
VAVIQAALTMILRQHVVAACAVLQLEPMLMVQMILLIDFALAALQLPVLDDHFVVSEGPLEGRLFWVPLPAFPVYDYY